MIEELVKEKHEQIDREETNKMMRAIHEQAYWKRVEDENKEILKKMEQKKYTSQGYLDAFLTSAMCSLVLSIYLSIILNAFI